MNKEQISKLTIWIMGISAGFLLRGNIVNSDTLLGYTSTMLFLGAGLMLIFKVPNIK